MNEDYKTRVIAEEEALKNKIVKLCNFIESEKFGNLETTDQFLLKRQYEIMNEYDHVLKSRIERFSN